MLERDDLDLKDSWSAANFNEVDGHRAAGQSFYIQNLLVDIPHMLVGYKEIEEDA
jgi:hypothetical protein